jgi:hypothetical protein
MQYASVNALFLKKLSENTEFLENMDQWMISKPMPSADLVKKHVLFSQFRKVLQTKGC